MVFRTENIRVVSFVGSLAGLALFASGCNSGGSSGGSAVGSVVATTEVAPAEATDSGLPVPSTPAPAQPPVATHPNVPVGESCVSSDPEKLCLAIHFVSYKSPTGQVTANEAQAASIIRTMNQLFGACNIGFQIEKFEAVDPTQYGLAYGAQSQNETNQIRETFKEPGNQLLSVTTGPWGTAVNAWTNMPGEGVYGAIMESSIVEYGAGIIYAHEFGHYLGLDHVSDSSDLMNPVIYTSSTALTSTQCQIARDTSRSSWAAMLRK